ncbi:hypothetical protein JZ751_022438 [Albula glossodonta]|uniref:Uncharacterized protein n=1 Tax=Albula glossodonta TaxID=121402 RepID=A0A8T2NQ89_9TELE|nr:hypothetical protein JZ751_022438 [Albula glossodonta]
MSLMIICGGKERGNIETTQHPLPKQDTTIETYPKLALLGRQLNGSQTLVILNVLQFGFGVDPGSSGQNFIIHFVDKLSVFWGVVRYCYEGVKYHVALRVLLSDTYFLIGVVYEEVYDVQLIGAGRQ